MASMFRICTIVGLGLAASMLQAQDRQGLEGVWKVSVTVTDCSGTILRTVTSVQTFNRDGSVIETSNLSTRGISEGVWKVSGDRMYDASYWFFRYPPPAGPYASFATVKETIALDSDNDHFTSLGTVVDNEPGPPAVTATSCFTHTATRLAHLDHDKDDSR